MKRKNKGGFSLVEVVISLALIVMVSVTALTIALSSITTKVNAINRSHAQDFADSVWECFKAAESDDEFFYLVQFAEGVNLHECEPIRDETSFYLYNYRYNSDKYGFVAAIALGTALDGRNELKVTMSDHKGEIISFSYKKGVPYNEVVPDGEEGGNEA